MPTHNTGHSLSDNPFSSNSFPGKTSPHGIDFPHTTLLQSIEIPSGTEVLDLLPQLHGLLQESQHPALLPIPAENTHQAKLLLDHLNVGQPIDSRVSLVMATSGTTGIPKGAMLTAAGLHSSITAAEQCLGGPGRWLLALPAHHIAGLQVLLRSIVADTIPVVMDVSHGFDPTTLPDAVTELHTDQYAHPGQRTYISLVPTQLLKALHHSPAVTALASFDRVLVGGAHLPTTAYQQALQAGIRVVRGYGMTETGGGCIYDGHPLQNVKVQLEHIDTPEHIDKTIGRVTIGGPMVALGYRNYLGHQAFATPGWFRTDDLGQLQHGVLKLIGRADDGISTGGLTVIPQVVEEVLHHHEAVANCAVFGLPHDQLGEQVCAVVVPRENVVLDVVELKQFLATQLDTTAIPRQFFFTSELPHRGPGKLDRRQIIKQFHPKAP